MFRQYRSVIQMGIAAIAAWVIASWIYGTQIDTEKKNLAEVKLKYADYKADIAQTMHLLNQRQLELNVKQQQAVSQLDQQHTQELFDVQENLDTVLNNISTLERRVFIRAKNPTCRPNMHSTTATASVDDAETRVELDPEDGAALYGYAAYGDETAIILTGLQDYVNNVCQKQSNQQSGMK